MLLGERRFQGQSGITFVAVFVAVAERGKSHGHQFGEEEEKYRHKSDAFCPIILSYYTCETWICEGVTGWSE